MFARLQNSYAVNIRVIIHTCEIRTTELPLWQETMSREYPLATSPGRNVQGD